MEVLKSGRTAMTFSRRLAAAGAVAGVLSLALVFGPAEAGQDTLTGTWEMLAYDGPAAVGKGTGLLVFSNGRFSLVYTMDGPPGARSGRAHAGRYAISGDRLVLDVDWSLEYVSGKGSVAAEPFQVRPTLTRGRDTITLTFEGGGVQTFRRIP